MTNEPCPRCVPFSPEILAIYRRLKVTDDQEERGELLLQLAHKFADEYDSTNDEFSENFHVVMDTYHQQYLAYNQAGLRLGRVLLHILESHTDIPVDEKIETTDRSVN
jgi:hypothetical protein